MEQESRVHFFANLLKYILTLEPRGLLNTTVEIKPGYFFYDKILDVLKEGNVYKYDII